MTTLSGSIETLLLIDDNELDQMLYKRIIERSGLVDQTLSFYYAEEALAFLERDRDFRVDVILLDINMPRMDGFEFLQAATERLGENFAKAVVVMLTTSLDPKDVERANSFSAVKDFLNKPLTAEHLKQISRLL